MPTPTSEEPGVPLGHYLTHEGVDVLLICNGCQGNRILPMAGVMRRLIERRINPVTFGIREVARLIDRPCPCGAMRWETRPHFPHETPGEREAKGR
jgi:hypothetical protein